MDTTAQPPEKVNGLATYLSLLTSPVAAFTQLARTPTWGWAAIIGIVLAIVSTILIASAVQHTTQSFQQQIIAHATADQQAQLRASFAQQNAGASWKPYLNSIVGTIASWLIVSLIVLIGASIGGGTASFSKAWTVALNAALPGMVGLVVNALIVMLRGASNANSFADLIALPSLGMLAPNNPPLAAFLAIVNPFQIWYYVVLVIGTERVLAAKRPAAVTAAAIVFLLTASLYAALAAVATMFTSTK